MIEAEVFERNVMGNAESLQLPLQLRLDFFAAAVLVHQVQFGQER